MYTGAKHTTAKKLYKKKKEKKKRQTLYNESTTKYVRSERSR